MQENERPDIPPAGRRNPWPLIIGMITTLSVLVIVLFMIL